MTTVAVPNRPTVRSVIDFETAGPWTTKSGAELRVLTHFPGDSVMGIPIEYVSERFLRYSDNELDRVSSEIMGIRLYTVRGIPAGAVGGTEFHRVREEMVFCLDGSVWWECEDLFGERREWVLTPEKGIWMPPYILHTYRALEAGSGLLVLANTRFDTADPKMRDTYPREEFEALQAAYREYYRFR